jgi:hypothetical protein
MGSYFVRSPIFIVPMEEFEPIWGLDFKTCLTLASEIGKLVSKVLGLLVVSRISRNSRLIIIITFNVLAMLLISLPFAFLEQIYQLVGMFLAMSMLSATFGMIVLYFEGRRLTETLATLSSISYLFGTGIAKSTGAFFLNYVSPRFMPLTVSLTFLPISLVALVLLDQVPDPDSKDIAHRSKRSAMPLKDQANFIMKFNIGIITVMLLNLGVLLVRNFRDYFAPEIYFYALQREVPEETYLGADVFGGVIAMLSLIFIPKVRNHKIAFYLMTGFTLLGGLILLGFTLLFHWGFVTGLPWLLSLAAGMWLIYLPINSAALWDRLFAITRLPGTGAFLIYAVDILGGIGTIVLMTWKLFFFHGDPGDLFILITMIVGSVVCVGTIVIYGYFCTVFKDYSSGVERLDWHDDHVLANWK